MSLIFIDYTCDLVYDNIGNKPIGGSEYQFYNLIFHISKLKNVICYNKIKNECIVNNIHYKNVKELNNQVLNSNDIIVIQRLIPEIKTLQLFKNNITYIWIHDYDFKSVFFQFQKLTNNNDVQNYLKYIVYNNNFSFIFNSEFTQKYYNVNFSLSNMNINLNRQSIIYNILYEDLFTKQINKHINKKTIVYASGWNKGIQKIIEIFEYILTQDSTFKLVLMSPGYEYKNYENYILYLKDKFKDNLIIYGPVNKDTYCKIVENSGCVLAPSFPETFGCVFAEAYYLGTPVICDVKSGAVKEIIGNDNIVNYNNNFEVYNKIISIINLDKKIELNKKFLLDYNLNIWKKLLNL